VTVEPGAGIVTVEPGAVTVTVEPGTVTVTVEPGAPGAPGGQTVTVEGGGQLSSQAKAREYKRKKIDRDFMARGELEKDGRRDEVLETCRRKGSVDFVTDSYDRYTKQPTFSLIR
jgi:hypothetical protein